MKDANCVLVKISSETTLKSHFVRIFFVNKLISNIKQVLRAKKLSGNNIKRGGGRLYIFSTNKKNISKIASALTTVFGIQAVAMCKRIPSSDKEEIKMQALEIALDHLKPQDTFAIRVKRIGKKDFSTKEIESEIGSLVNQKIKNLKVDLKNPMKKISIEVKPGESFFYESELQGPIGLPLGVEGNVAVFFEGKKSELTAAFLMMKRGCNVFPVLKNNSKKLQMHVNKLSKWNSFRNFFFSLEKDFETLVEKKDIAIKAVVMSDNAFSKNFIIQKKKFGVPVFWPLVFFPKELEKKYLDLVLK